jgi:hypothetical protein
VELSAVVLKNRGNEAVGKGNYWRAVAQ